MRISDWSSDVCSSDLVETNRIGPRHRGVVGRPVASVPDYDYSPALKQLGGTWTPARLDLWLSDTQEMVPRSKMYLALDDADQRRLIIAYLKSVSGAGGAPCVSNVAIFRSEETTSELQSLMSITY